MAQSSAAFRPDEPIEVDPDFEPSSGVYQPQTAVPPQISQAGSAERYQPPLRNGESKYFLPHDDVEQDRLDFQHAGLTVLLDGRLSLAPLPSEPRLALDIATGTGIWAIEYAHAHPNTCIIGTDLEKMQPDNAPPNVEWLAGPDLGDAENEWPAELQNLKGQFDYIHLRAVFTCFNEPKVVMQRIFDHLRPGGTVEYMDSSFSIDSSDGSADGSTIYEWGRLLIRGAANKGRDIEVSQHYKQWMAEIGFIDIVESKLAWPYNQWPKHPRLKLAGSYLGANFTNNVRQIGNRLLTAAELSEDEIEKVASGVMRDISNPHIHAFLPIWVVYGQKPLPSESGQET